MNPQNNKISLLLITKNEQDNIAKNFSWLSQVPDITQIVVIDDESTDKTIDELQKLSSPNLKINVYKRKLNSDFSAQREFGLTHCKNDWILWLDADETPSPDLISFLTTFNPESPTDFAFKRNDFFLGRQLGHGETANQFFLRLFHKSSGKFIGTVHERWQSDRGVTQLNFPIIHNSHPTLGSFLHQINFYTDIRAKELFRQNHRTNLFEIVAYPPGKFLYDYIILLGFLDSTQGIIMALCMSFHSFLVRSKLWHLWHQT